MPRKPTGKPPKPTQSSQSDRAIEPALQLLLTTLTELVVDMIQAKCHTLTNRERKTLERGIDKAIRLFVEGQKPKP